MSIDKAKPRVSSERVNVSDLVDTVELDGKWKLYRFLDTDHLSVASHWIPITTKAGKETRFPKICLRWDSHTEDDKPGVVCPYCDAGLDRSIAFYFNAISREHQEDEPAKKSKRTESERETGFKEKGSKTWTPVKVLQLSNTTTAKVQGLNDLNSHKTKSGTKVYPISDNRYGMDVNLKYDDKATTAANKYTVNSGDKSSLSEDELEYLVWDLGDENFTKRLGQESLEQAKNELKRLKANGVVGGKNAEEEDDDDDYDMGSKKRKRPRDDEDDEDDEPVKSKKSKKKSFEDDDEDDEDETPRKKAKKSFEDDEDDEDDEPVKSKKSKKKSFEDDEDDEDDEPVKSKKSKKKSFEDDEDDEDETPRKKAKKKRSFEDDEDDD